jgi:purine-binding chemotaxis protein CheW
MIDPSLNDSATAVAETAARTDATQCQYVSFWIGKQLLGVPVDMVQEVLNPQAIARTPRAQREIAGLLNLRGQIVTAVDLRRRLRLPDRDEDTQPMNVVVRHHNDEPFSLLVDEVGDVVDVAADRITEAPHTLETHYKTVTKNVVRLDGQLLIILDVAALLDF